MTYEPSGLRSGTTSSYVGAGLGTGFARPLDGVEESSALGAIVAMIVQSSLLPIFVPRSQIVRKTRAVPRIFNRSLVFKAKSEERKK